MTEFQLKKIAAAALVLWARRAVNGSDDDADAEFQRAVTLIIAETASE